MVSANCTVHDDSNMGLAHNMADDELIDNCKSTYLSVPAKSSKIQLGKVDNSSIIEV